MNEPYKRKPNTSCGICGKKIYRRPGSIRHGAGNVYCSSKCYGKACRKEIPCTVCGKLILAGANKKTCSRSCSNIQRKGIKYTGSKMRDKVVSQKRIKVRLILECGEQCGRCGYNALPQILQVHHKDRNRNHNSLRNLELLCPNCHATEHYVKN